MEQPLPPRRSSSTDNVGRVPRPGSGYRVGAGQCWPVQPCDAILPVAAPYLPTRHSTARRHCLREICWVPPPRRTLNKGAQPAPTRPGLAPVITRICPAAASLASFCCSGHCCRQTGPGWHSWVIAMLRPRAAGLGGAEPVWHVVHSAAWLAVETCLASTDHRSA